MRKLDHSLTIILKIIGLTLIFSWAFIFTDKFIIAKDIPASGIYSATAIKTPTLFKHPYLINNNKPGVCANAVYLIDVNSSYAMFAKNENAKVPIASTTKVATALVVLENHAKNINDIVTVASEATVVEGSRIQLQPGEKIRVSDLLNGLLIYSGNDTAYALAYHFGGKDKFVQEMNEKVKNIGLADTHYEDPSGLNDNGYSTARDLAILGAYALRNKNFSDTVKTPQKDVYSADGSIKHELKTSNRMLRNDEPYFYENVIGIKTGFTYAAGHVLMSAAKKDKNTILGVVMNTCEDSAYASAIESKKLLEWGFANWRWN